MTAYHSGLPCDPLDVTEESELHPRPGPLSWWNDGYDEGYAAARRSAGTLAAVCILAGFAILVVAWAVNR